MGSSAKKKKEKKKDFQKTKLKVGKAKPQSANATSTSFKAKSIVLNQQINANAPSTNNQFSHHVSLLSSRSDSQRKESLSYLASILSGPLRDQPLPVSSEHLLDKSMPLILDANHGVRSELYKVLQAMPSHHLRDHITRIIPYVRAAMTHLSADIRKTALDVLSWLLSSTGEDLVSCPGGWTKTLDCCATLLNWKNLAPSESWTASKSHFRSDTKAIAQAMQVIDQALTIGLLPSDKPDRTNQDFSYPLCDYEHHRLPSKANAYGYLDLFGKPIDDDSRMLEGREERLIVFKDRFQSSFVRGTEGAKKEGGDLGRIAGQLSKTLDAVARDD